MYPHVLYLIVYGRLCGYDVCISLHIHVCIRSLFILRCNRFQLLSFNILGKPMKTSLYWGKLKH